MAVSAARTWISEMALSASDLAEMFGHDRR
jgi:hypothetical protein